jgi:hypothetical protein
MAINTLSYLPTINEHADNEPTCENANSINHASTTTLASRPLAARAAMSACDMLTMETMMNMDMYSKCMKKRQSHTASLTSDQMQADSTERKFYRRRIIDMTKELCRNSVHRDSGNARTSADPAVMTAFNAYTRACIMHFKFIDLADTLQDEYAGLRDSIGGGAGIATELSHLSELPDLSKFDKLCFNPAANGSTQSKIIQIGASSSNSLERLFMAKTEPTKEVNDKTGSRAAASTFITTLPKIKDVNLMDEQFKTKGINSVGRSDGGKKNKFKNGDAGTNTSETEYAEIKKKIPNVNENIK